MSVISCLYKQCELCLLAFTFKKLNKKDVLSGWGCTCVTLCCIKHHLTPCALNCSATECIPDQQASATLLMNIHPIIHFLKPLVCSLFSLI